jgi:hypothetical protein
MVVIDCKPKPPTPPANPFSFLLERMVKRELPDWAKKELEAHQALCLECCRHSLDPERWHECVAAQWFQHMGKHTGERADSISRRFPETISIMPVPVRGWAEAPFNHVVVVITAASSFQVWHYTPEFERLVYHTFSPDDKFPGSQL